MTLHRFINWFITEKNIMTVETYEQQFEAILSGENQSHPYDKDAYVNYVKMNRARINRWEKTAKLLPELIDKITSIEERTEWLLITEPWCGDAAHSHAFIKKLAALNPNINLIIQNRDAEGSEIDQYLTNGSKSIPKLVARDADGNDLFIWGPRPEKAQAMVMNHLKDPTTDDETHKRDLQKWYNKDKGVSIQAELNQLIETYVSQKVESLTI